MATQEQWEQFAGLTTVEFDDELETVLLQMRNVLLRKRESHGPHNLSRFVDIGMLVHVGDRLERLMYMHSHASSDSEAAMDAWRDIAGYALLMLVASEIDIDEDKDEPAEDAPVRGVVSATGTMLVAATAGEDLSSIPYRMRPLRDDGYVFWSMIPPKTTKYQVMVNRDNQLLAVAQSNDMTPGYVDRTWNLAEGIARAHQKRDRIYSWPLGYTFVIVPLRGDDPHTVTVCRDALVVGEAWGDTLDIAVGRAVNIAHDQWRISRR